MKKTILSAIPFSHSVSRFDAEEEIELYGYLPGVTRGSVIHPIRAFKSSTGLRASFQHNQGNIAVIIYSEDGSVVYERNVNASEKDQLLIDLSTLEQGNYEIRVINTKDWFKFGEFEIRSS